MLTGSPGTGKTFATAAIVREMIDRLGRNAIALAAPTGKAAVRITDALQRAGVPNLIATTIHTLLGIERDGHDGEGWNFKHNATNPLPYKIVIVDESSMLDTTLAADLLDACAPGTHVLFVGDPEQLPPVGHGSPLRDMIAAGLPNGELSEIKRQDGRPGNMIIEACAAIRNRRPFVTADTWDLANGRNLVHIEAATPARQVEELQRLYAGIRRGGKRDILWDVQVLVCCNKGDLGRKPVNAFLQAELNADGFREDKNPFRQRDKIICLQNSWQPHAEEKDTLVYVANGDVGQIVTVEKAACVADFVAPRRSIRFKLNRGATGEEGQGQGRGRGQGRDTDGTDRDDGRDDEARASSVPGCKFDLAYAITVHKSQGSEVPVVIFLIDGSRGAAMIANRNLVYTAISRASQLCITVGRRGVLEQMAARVSLEKRKTFLRELLTEI